MRLLCLDLSTKTGWSIIEDNAKLIEFGNIKKKIEGDETSSDYPNNYIKMAKDISFDVIQLIKKFHPDYIIIEETNKGKNRYSQKALEFIHFAVNDILYACPFKCPIVYLDTSEWRYLLNLSLNKDQRKTNKEIKLQRDNVRTLLERQFDQDHPQSYSLACAHKKKRDRNFAIKEYMKIRTEWVNEKLRSFRSKVDGKVVGKINMKTLSVEYVNNELGTKFKKKDNDITDSICLGLAYQKKLLNNNV